MTWHDIMAYAHQGIELRPLPGLPPPQHAPTRRRRVAGRAADAPQPVLLTRKGTEALVHVEHLLDDAEPGARGAGRAPRDPWRARPPAAAIRTNRSDGGERHRSAAGTARRD